MQRHPIQNNSHNGQPFHHFLLYSITISSSLHRWSPKPAKSVEPNRILGNKIVIYNIDAVDLLVPLAHIFVRLFVLGFVFVWWSFLAVMGHLCLLVSVGIQTSFEFVGSHLIYANIVGR